MKSNFKPTARKNDIVIQTLEDELLIFDLKLNKAICLNKTSSLVWQFCDGKRTVEEISDQMSKHTKALISEDLVWFGLEQLNKDGLLDEELETSERFAGLSRREVIRKIGLTSMITLPMIGVVVAPTAAFAQSACTAPQGGCVNPGTCCSGTCSVSNCCVPLTQTCVVPNDCCNNPMSCVASACV